MKRFLFAVAALTLLFMLAACGRTALSTTTVAETPGTTPTSSTSRNVRNAPVTVTETYANTDVVAGTATGTPTTAPTPEATSTNTPAASTASPSDTPSTGDFPITYFAGVLGLILICSAGLIMLKRI